MELAEARRSIGLLAYYRCTDLPAAMPMQVRIMSTEEALVRVSVQLDAALPTSPDQCFAAFPEELHFERSAFDP